MTVRVPPLIPARSIKLFFQNFNPFQNPNYRLVRQSHLTIFDFSKFSKHLESKSESLRSNKTIWLSSKFSTVSWSKVGNTLFSEISTLSFTNLLICCLRFRAVRLRCYNFVIERVQWHYAALITQYFIFFDVFLLQLDS